MDKNSKTILKISLMVLPIIFFSSISLANETDAPTEEYNSMYRYNALESKVNFFRTESEVVVLLEENTVDKENIKKLENITKRQTDSIEKSDQAMRTIEGRARGRTFLLGNSLGALKFRMVQMGDQVYALKTLIPKIEDPTIKDQINSQIDILEQEQKKVEKFILKKDDKFSLLGWLVSSL